MVPHADHGVVPVPSVTAGHTIYSGDNLENTAAHTKIRNNAQTLYPSDSIRNLS